MKGSRASRSRSAGVVSFFAVLAYFIAVAERSSLGVAALDASNRFGISAAQLSSLTVFQLIVYAAMQIPVGVLLDRFGSRRLLVVGGLLMASGQMLVASTNTFEVAVAGRALLGIGDAFTFISMIRLIDNWYKGSAATRRTQLFANIGQLGQVFSAIPFAAFLHASGWANAFYLLAALAVLGAICTLLLVRDSRQGNRALPASSTAELIGNLRQNLRDPAVRLAFWTHFTTQFSGSVFVLLWGYTFLTSAQQLPAEVASVLIASFVAIGFVAGPVFSAICANRPHWRSRVVITTAGAVVALWSVVLAWSGPAPLWVIVLLILVIGSGGPASMMAFDFTRKLVPPHRLGSANGIANIGGFLATFVTMFLVGLLLDFALRSGWTDGLYSLDGFRLALPIQFAVIAVGVIGFLVERKKAKSRYGNNAGL